MNWTLATLSRSTVSRRRQQSRRVGSWFAWLISPWTTCAYASHPWRINLKTLSLSQSNLLSGTTKPTKPLPRLANAWRALRNRPRIIICIMLGATVMTSNGCGSLRNVREIDFSITGLEMEFYPEHPSQEQKGFFGTTTNTLHAIPASFPQLMPRNVRN